MMRLDRRAGQYMAAQTQITSASSHKSLSHGSLWDHIYRINRAASKAKMDI